MSRVEPKQNQTPLASQRHRSATRWGILRVTVTCLALAVNSQSPAEDAAPRADGGDAARGASLYKRYCRGCHGADGRGGGHTFMPHVGSLTREGYIDRLPDAYLFAVIAEGGEAMGKSAYMPAWQSKLSVQDITDLIAHIRSLPRYR